MNRHRFLILLAVLPALLGLHTPVFAQEAHEHDEHEEHEGEHVEMSHIDAAMAAQLGVTTAVASSQAIHETVPLYGRITPDPQQVSHVTARYPGLIRQIMPALGEQVEAGEVIASIESNDSLQAYEIRASINGIVVERHANPGEFAGGQPLLTIADYSRVWADLLVFPGDQTRIQPGQAVYLRLQAPGESLEQNSEISYLNPGTGTLPTVVARTPLDNPEHRWVPGLFVQAEVSLSSDTVPVAVANRALQRYEGQQVVFVQEGDEYHPRPVQTGRSDTRNTEILSGLNAGERYVLDNSYLIKADLEKSSATHQH